MRPPSSTGASAAIARRQPEFGSTMRGGPSAARLELRDRAIVVEHSDLLSGGHGGIGRRSRSAESGARGHRTSPPTAAHTMDIGAEQQNLKAIVLRADPRA
jgi:hypothetical protein